MKFAKCFDVCITSTLHCLYCFISFDFFLFVLHLDHLDFTHVPSFCFVCCGTHEVIDGNTTFGYFHTQREAVAAIKDAGRADDLLQRRRPQPSDSIVLSKWQKTMASPSTFSRSSSLPMKLMVRTMVLLRGRGTKYSESLGWALSMPGMDKFVVAKPWGEMVSQAWDIWEDLDILDILDGVDHKSKLDDLIFLISFFKTHEPEKIRKYRKI